MYTDTSSSADAVAHRQLLQGILDEMVGAGITGFTLRVRDEHGEWTASAGRAQLGQDAPPPIDGHVRIGSNTKTFVATIALALVAEGRLELDAPVAPILPELGIDERITLRMLLRHTSGVFNHTGEYGADGTPEFVLPSPPMGKAWVDARDHAFAPEELAWASLAKPLRFEPGTSWSYSNTNFVIVRLLIEQITGRTLAQELQRVVIEPLGLRGTIQPAGDELPEPYAHAYYRYDDEGTERTVDVSRHDPSWVSSGGDMISTTADLQALITALATGTLLPAAQLAEMRATRETPIPGMGYGLGLFVQDLGEHRTLLTHNGGMAGHAALMYATPDGRRVMTGSVNYIDDAAMTMAVPFQTGSARLVDAMFRRPLDDPRG